MAGGYGTVVSAFTRVAATLAIATASVAGVQAETGVVGKVATLDAAARSGGPESTGDAPATAQTPPPPAEQPATLTGPRIEPAPAAGEIAAPIPPPADPIVMAVIERLKRPVAGVSKDDLAALNAFYRARTGPAFVANGAFNAAGAAIAAELGRADDWGLASKSYSAIAPLAPEPAAMAEAEVGLAAAALRYARHASGGRVDPSTLSRFNDLRGTFADPDEVLAALSSGGKPDAYLVSLHPQHPQFQKLRAALVALRSGAAKPVEPAVEPTAANVPAVGPTLKSGSQHPDVVAIRARLDVPANGPANLYDDGLVDAVKAFQTARGIKATGVLNAATRTALAGGVETTRKPADPARETERIVLNMERWRWMPRDLGAFHIVNNVPEFTTRVFKDGQVVFKERIVVGKTNTPTPVFSANMQFIVFQPEWGVPDSIKVKEIWPSLRRSSPDDLFGFTSDTRVLQRHNMRVAYNGRTVDASKIDWSKADPRQYSFIQAAGSTNVLGVVKFRFPNRHDVYMHDTQERSLFQQTTRAYSHGCMRVNNPRRLAEVILGEVEQPAWSPERVGAAIANKQTQEVKLDRPFPVHSVYLTARVDEVTGKLETFGDLYGHDARLIAALAGKAVSVEPQETKDELSAEVRKQVKAKGQSKDSDGLSQFFGGLFAN